ncbi:MAG: hypothetical protein OEX09_01915 [Candidatus Bathyarchaeota archaeon]|nr:hypothetical protein [Candidatus Bathyarchaeota archaeon]
MKKGFSHGMKRLEVSLMLLYPYYSLAKLIRESCFTALNSAPREVVFLNIQTLMRRAFHLRQRIDTLKQGEYKQQLIKIYAKIIWQIQEHGD